MLRFRFVPAWKRSVDTSAYHNKQYPMEDEKLYAVTYTHTHTHTHKLKTLSCPYPHRPTPIITDLNSDGSTGTTKTKKYVCMLQVVDRLFYVYIDLL